MAKRTKPYRLVQIIEEKSHDKFKIFDFKCFYPSIKETLTIKAINFAKKRVNIPKEDKTNYKT